MTNQEQHINLAEWYSPTEAAARLTANSGRPIDVSYVRTLARYGKIASYQISERIRLYRKADVDTYIVEDRGEKSARAKRQKALEKSKKEKAIA